MNTKRFCQRCNFFQWTGKLSRCNEIPLALQITLQAFDKWAVDFVGPISPLGKRTITHYIITTRDYLTRWAEASPVKDCTGVIAKKFLFENMVTRFGCPKILLSDQGTHFVKKMINEFTTEFQIQHRKMKPYHPQANGMVEAFNKIQENALTKVCNVCWDDWDHKVSAVLWVYRTTCKQPIGHTPFRLVYR